jgi:hypothetical protein
LEPVHVEPLDGRNEAQVNRTCIVQCPECNKMYTSTWI